MCGSVWASSLACGDGEEGTVGPEDLGAECLSATFVAPIRGARLQDADDADSHCYNGIQVRVAVATDAPDATPATLLLDGNEVTTVSVWGAVAQFGMVQLPATLQSEDHDLRATIGGARGCAASAKVFTRCEGPPSCEITSPTVSETHPQLNNMPQAGGGDRSSAAGSPYQVTVEVRTSARDGQFVTLNVDGRVSLSAASVTEGVAFFPGVTLEPDGEHSITASCLGVNGKWGISTETFEVDTVAPQLTVLQPMGGTRFVSDDDADPDRDGIQVEVCGTTLSPDAMNLPDALGPAQNNFCAVIGNAPPSCAPMVGDDQDEIASACVKVTCPQITPFVISARVRDDAGNLTEQRIGSLSCLER